ncbi:MAG: peptidylprolyl isomerase [Rickettsiales bacterium]|jgi:peptidylprolyl isomerase|nr:peptidylprolyl isomerase [Rickettsiales bacterium]
MKKFFIMFYFLSGLIFAESVATSTDESVNIEEKVGEYEEEKKEESVLEPKNTLYIELKDGIVVAELLPSLAPKHVQRIRELASEGFYNDIVFHRVIKGFMAQTGDPTGTGRGGSQMGRLYAEFNNEKHVKGILSMARSADVNSANSQFFIVTGTSFPELDGQYTIFGKVIKGMQYVEKIKTGDSTKNGLVSNPDKMLAVITGEMLNNKPFNIVEEEIKIVNELQKDKIKEDADYEKKPILELLLAVKDIDITSDTEEKKIAKKKNIESKEDKLKEIKNTADAVGEVIKENQVVGAATDAFKDITGDTFSQIGGAVDKTGEDIERKKKEKELEEKIKNRTGAK